jgi:hypothetical protein
VRLTALALFVLAACGGSEASPAAPAAPPSRPPAAAGDGGEHGEHGALPPELAAFHDALAPRWHAEPGAARVKDTCAAVADFSTRAAAVKAASAPQGADAAAWSDAGAALEKAVADLDATCREGDAAGTAKFDAAFTAVHDAFHHAMEAAGGGHHMGHGEGTGDHQGSGEHSSH